MSSNQKFPPYGIVKSLGLFRGLLLKLHSKLFPASVVLYEQFQSFWLLQPLYIAAKLNIAGLLNEKPLSIEELAIKTNARPDPLYRVLRALSSEGIFREMEGRRFKLNSRSRALLEGDGSMRNIIIHHLGNINWTACGNMLHAVTTGESAFTGLHGIDIYPFLQQNPEELGRFEKSMTELSALASGPVLSRYDFSKYTTVADIGGGEGLLLSEIVKKHPGLKGIVFDLPENSAKAREYIRSGKLDARMTYTPGSFFEPFSIQAEVYLMKNVLHNWDDAQCSIILTNLRNTMKQGAVLLILEMVVPGPNIPSYSKLVDMQMLATLPGGRERTLAEFESLLKKSGFRMKRLIPTIAPMAILETVMD